MFRLKTWISRPGVGKLQLLGQIYPPPVFVNKILLELAVPIHLSIVYDCFCTTEIELSSCSRGHEVHKVKHIYYLALYRKFANTFSREEWKLNGGG